MRRYTMVTAGNVSGLVQCSDGKWVRFEDTAHMRHEMLNISADLAALIRVEGMPMEAIAKLQKLSRGLVHLALDEDSKKPQKKPGG